MKQLFLQFLSCLLLANTSNANISMNFIKLKESKLTVKGKNTLYAGSAITFAGGLLYLKSTTQKIPNTNTFTTRGVSNRIISLGVMGAGITTIAIGGVLFGIGKSKDAIKHKRKVSYYISPLGQIGLVVKL
jgi:hypothetical protein